MDHDSSISRRSPGGGGGSDSLDLENDRSSYQQNSTERFSIDLRWPVLTGRDAEVVDDTSLSGGAPLPSHQRLVTGEEAVKPPADNVQNKALMSCNLSIRTVPSTTYETLHGPKLGR